MKESEIREASWLYRNLVLVRVPEEDIWPALISTFGEMGKKLRKDSLAITCGEKRSTLKAHLINTGGRVGSAWN